MRKNFKFKKLNNLAFLSKCIFHVTVLLFTNTVKAKTSEQSAFHPIYILKWNTFGGDFFYRCRDLSLLKKKSGVLIARKVRHLDWME
jgi:hypothetical protein